HLPQSRSDQHCLLEMSCPERDSFWECENLCFGIKFGVIDHIKPGEDEAIRPKACQFACSDIDVAAYEQLMQRVPPRDEMHPRHALDPLTWECKDCPNQQQ